MQLALGRMRLSPAVFWSMTPRELEAAVRGFLGPDTGDAPCPRSTLVELMSRFPD